MVLLYDGDCGFCSTSSRWSRRLGCDVQPIPYQVWPGLAESRITAAAAAQALHLVAPDGRVWVGHEAVAATLQRSDRRPVRLAGRALRSRLVAPLAARIYGWVAEHRHRLPGGTPTCSSAAPRPVAGR